MNDRDVRILGVCRFSMLGRGDWKAYRNQPDNALEAIYANQSKDLFTPDRLESRLATFEHLTLRSLANQSDADFRFLVVSSDRLPDPYRDRLQQICKGVDQVVLRFLPPTHISDAIHGVARDIGVDLPETVQFRLDDDDCVSRDYIRRLRRHATCLWRNAHFAVSFPAHFYCISDGPTEGVYNWYSPFFSAGAAIRHSSRTIFDYGHYAIPTRLVAVTDPHFPNIVTHRGDNDTPRHAPEILRKRGMSRASRADVERAVERHFDYLTDAGMELCGFDRMLATA